MKYHNITHDDMLNGSGLRVVLWVSGCDHNCPECQNPITWDINGGIDFDIRAREEIYFDLKKGYVSGITLSGGDPLHLQNRDEITALAKDIKEKFPTKTIWLYTGYLWEDVCDLEIMKYVDVAVEGPFIAKLKDEKLHWRGSSNQRIVNVPETLREGNVILLED